MFLDIILITIGFVLLILGANVLIEGASNIAKKLNIPEMLIGLSIVAIGTSLPELIITITSASKGTSDLIIGNAIGSNICNLLLTLGIVSIIKPIKVDKEAKKIHIPILVIVTCIILLIATGVIGISENEIDKSTGTLLLIMFISYFIYPIIKEINNIKKNYKENKDKKNINLILSFLYIVIGIIFLKYGGDFVVNNSISIAKIWGISEEIIGLTIVAFGTSLPELVTSVVAIIKGDEDLAIGNLIGSCIFNLLLILGVGAIITTLEFSYQSNQNLALLAIVTLLIWIFNYIGKKKYITRTKGIILLLVFIGYTINLFKWGNKWTDIFTK